MKLLDQHYQRVKNAIHGIQGLGILVAWILTIAVFTRDGKSGGQTKYFFALCWFTIPILIYQTAVPIFTRTKRFSNAYAHAAVDVLFTILWLAAFAAVAAWTNQGISDGDETDGKGCDIFANGSPGKCKLSQGSVGCGVIIWLLFIATSALSIYALLYYRRNGSLPGSTSGAVPISDQTNYAFSSNPHDADEFDEEAHDLHNADDHHDAAYDPHIAMAGGRGARDDDEYQSLHADTEEGAHPGRPLSWGQKPQASELGGHHAGDEDTSYHGASTAYSQQRHQAAQDPFRNPSPYRHPSPAATGPYDHAPQLPPLGGSGDPFRDDLALSHDHGGYGGAGRVDIPDASDYRPGSRLA